MMKLNLILVLACLAIVLAEPGVPQRGLIHQIQRGVAGPNPYVFLTVPKGRSQSLVEGFEVLEDDNDDDDGNDDDDDDDQQDDDIDNEEDDNMPKNGAAADDDDNEEQEENHDVINMKKFNQQIKNGKATQMMISREHAGAIMVPDGVIQIEGQSVIDEKTGKPALLLPRAILDTIPDGSVVALMERTEEPSAEERANRVVVRRRSKGARRNIKRRGGATNKRRRGGANNKRRRVNRRGGANNKNRRRINKNNKNRKQNGGNRPGKRPGNRPGKRPGNRPGNGRPNNKRKNNRPRVVYQA